MNQDFGIEKTKITAVRHGAAETHHRIRLRLNAGQLDHQKQLRLLKEMMAAQEYYLLNHEAIVDQPIEAVETAALYAGEVLKTEWKTVKLGEQVYRNEVRTTSYTLKSSLAVLAAKPASPAAAVAVPAAKVAAPALAPAILPAAVSE